MNKGFEASMDRQQRAAQWGEGREGRNGLNPRSPNRQARGMLGTFAWLAWMALALAPSACCLVRPPNAKTLLAAGEAGWRTPEAAFETFRVAFGSDLPELEFKSLSDGFREREQLSFLTYQLGRKQLLQRQPWIALLARASVIGSQKLSARRHRLVVQAAGKHFVVDEVREDVFQIYAGDEFLADGTLDFDSAVRLSDYDGGKTLSVLLPLAAEEYEGVDLSRATSYRVEQVWKIDRFGEEPRGP